MNSPKSKVLIAAGALAALAGAVVAATHPFASRGLSAAELKRAETARVASGTLKQRFALLSQRHTNQCGLSGTSLSKLAVHGRLQGSCCRRMDFDHYVQQVRGLRVYDSVAEIPADPYDISIGLAKRLIGYGHSIDLNPAQQSIYDQAVRLSKEHGPCCCHCWRWHAFDGQAKELIARRHFPAARIAHVWNLEDGCGGAA